MTELSDPSGPNTATQDYISKKVAIDLLKKLLEQQEIDDDLKKQLLKNFRKNLKTYSENIALLQNSSINLKVILSIRGIEIKVPEGVEVEFIEEKTDSVKKMTPELVTETDKVVGEKPVKASDNTEASGNKCSHPGDPDCPQ